MKKLILLVTAVLATVVSAPAAQASGPGGGTIQTPRTQANVAVGRVPVTVQVSPGLVGTRAGIFTVPGWSLRLQDQPRGSFDYDLFRIPSRTFTIHAPAPVHAGRYTIRINRDGRDHSGIAQVRVTFRHFEVGRLRATPGTFFPLIHDGYRDCTTINWFQALPGRATMQVIGKGQIQLGHRSAGSSHEKWCGAVGGHRLGTGTYQVRIRAVDDMGTTTASSGILHVAIRTAHLTRTWSVTQSGGDTLGYHTYKQPCDYYRNAIESGDALIDCRGGGVGSLFWKVPLRSDYAIGRYHYTVTGSYRFRSATGTTAGQYSHLNAQPKYVMVEIGQRNSWLEIVKVVLRFHLETTV